MTGRSLLIEHRKKLSLVKIRAIRPVETRTKIKRTLLGKNNEHLKKVHPLIPKSSKSHSHLTGEEVKNIRTRFCNEKGASIRKLAEDYNVSKHTIHSIVTYMTWT